jgi:hypothetical protein
MVRTLLAVALVLALTPRTAHAYLDPISGSIILQALIAGALGALLTIKRVSFAIRAFFSSIWKRIRG